MKHIIGAYIICKTPKEHNDFVKFYAKFKGEIILNLVSEVTFKEVKK